MITMSMLTVARDFSEGEVEWSTYKVLCIAIYKRMLLPPSLQKSIRRKCAFIKTVHCINIRENIVEMAPFTNSSYGNEKYLQMSV